MDEFAEINRRVFRAFARLPVNFVVCHDDIVLAQRPGLQPGTGCTSTSSPATRSSGASCKEAGKEVIFMVDGCVDAFADDVMACGARGIISEPFTDYKAIARAIRELLHRRRRRQPRPDAQRSRPRSGRWSSRMVETAPDVAAGT